MLFLVSCSIFLSLQEEPARGVSHYNLPPHGVIYKESVHGFFADFQGYPAIYSHPLEKPDTKKMGEFMSTWGKYHCRLHGSFIGLWFWYSDSQVYSRPFDDPFGRTYPLPALREKIQGTPKGWENVAMDFSPVSRSTCRVFFFPWRPRKLKRGRRLGPMRNGKTRTANTTSG